VVFSYFRDHSGSRTLSLGTLQKMRQKYLATGQIKHRRFPENK
jgi:hypothetical protein